MAIRSCCRLLRAPPRRPAAGRCGRSGAGPGRERSAALAGRRVGGVHASRSRTRPRTRTTPTSGSRAGTGQQQIRLTRSPAERARAALESRTAARSRSSPNRDDPREVDQVWLLDRAGGEPERVTDLPGGVSDLAWSPDGHRLALIASDPDPDAKEPGDTSSRAPTPIVIDRFQFKADETGWLESERDHLYLFDLATRAATQLLAGEYDEAAPAWSPDGRSIAFVSRRRPEYDRTDNYDLYVVEATAGAEPRQLTTFAGPDQDPEWGSRAPAWSPDGSPDRLRAGRAAQRCSTTAVRRWRWCRPPAARRAFSRPRSTGTCCRPPSRTTGRRCCSCSRRPRVSPRARAGGRRRGRARRGGQARADRPRGRRGADESRWPRAARARRPRSTRWRTAASSGRSRGRTRHGWPRSGSRRWKKFRCGAATAPRSTASWSSRRTIRPGRRYPTILRIHGGPVWQFYHDFADLDWQVLAANGYVVLGVNPRGSSGRGEKFSTAIWAKWGQKDGEDVLAAVDWAVKQGIADPERLGVGGWSYGGILTDEVIARDRRFKAATSGAGHGQRTHGLRHRPVREGVRGRAGHAVEEPQGVHGGLVSVPARRPDRDADALPVRRPGLERAR